MLASMMWQKRYIREIFSDEIKGIFMFQRTNQILFALLRSVICNKNLTDTELSCYSSELLPELLKISSKHDIAHLLVLGLKKNSLISKENMGLEQYITKAIYRYEQIKYEQERIYSALEKSQIPFLPLKGTVIRKYYPESWMRTSCDIDILVHEEDAEKAVAVLIEKYGYIYHRRTSHDLALFTPNKIHVELHYDLVEDGVANESSEVLKNVWNTAVVRAGFDFLYDMPDEIYYFYHIAHMAKHFAIGGCGIRPFIDLWILDNIKEKNEQKRNEILNQGKLLKFAQEAGNLSKVWFDGVQYNEISRQMEYFILKGGVYGSIENRIMFQQQKKGGRIKYLMSKIFIPYEELQYHYPILQKHRWLTPIMEIRRWFKLISVRHAKATIGKVKYNQNISGEKNSSVEQFLSNIGL